MRGATVRGNGSTNGLKISTHTPRAGRDPFEVRDALKGLISTHTPRAGRDGLCTDHVRTDRISTHTPRAGRDGVHPGRLHRNAGFLLTRPVRGV